MTTITPFKTDLRLRPKIPAIDHVPRSYALLVRDGILARIKAMSFFANVKKFASSKALQVQAQDLPYVAVHFVEESLMPDGDANAGEPRFRSSVQIGFSVWIAANDPEAAENKLDDCYQAIVNGLLQSSDIFIAPNDHVMIQSFTRGRRMHAFGSVGLNNELPVAELQFTLVCDLGTLLWEPVVLDPLEVIHVTTEHSDTDENSEKIISEYDLQQNSE